MPFIKTLDENGLAAVAIEEKGEMKWLGSAETVSPDQEKEIKEALMQLHDMALDNDAAEKAKQRLAASTERVFFTPDA